MIPFGVFLTSIFGSLHCASMCGGLVLAATDKDRKFTQVVYHVSRLMGYLLLGAIAGFFGGELLASTNSQILSYISSGFIALILFYSGILILKGKSLTFGGKLWNSQWVKRSHVFALQQKNVYGKSSLVGFLSAFLPCGWLYSFVLAAVASQSVLSGMLVLTFFWLGSLPALTFGPEFFRYLIAPIIKKSPKASGILFIAIALLIVGFRVLPFGDSAHCEVELFHKHETP